MRTQRVPQPRGHAEGEGLGRDEAMVQVGG